VRAMYEDEIAVKVRALPEALKREVLDFTDFLLSKQSGKKARKEKFRFNWEGGLADIGEDISSVELSHQSMEWR
jgi:hypothetical protein